MEEGAIVDGPDGTAYIVRGGQLVPMGVPAAQPSFAPVTLGQADPTRSAKAQADLLAARAREALIRAQTDSIQNPRSAPPSGYRYAADGSLERIPGAPPVKEGGVTPAVRAASIAGYKTSQQLRRLISEMETLYKQGPGSTQGVSSLTDYLPTTVNKRFDAAGNAARGIVGSALGFTGGQLNTAAEAAMAVGPYLPQASDRDEVIQDKINRLRDLADQAEQRSIAQLGGRPDQNGNIQPVAGVAPASGQGGGGAQGGGAQQPMSPSPIAPAGSATGTEKKVRDESKSPAVAALQTLLRSGAPDDQVRAAAAALNASPGSVSAVLDFRRKNPGYRGSYDLGDLGTRTERTSGFERLAASPVGAYFANAANAGTAGLLGAATGTTEDFRRLSRENPTAGLLGEITGAGLGAAGLELGLGAAAARTGINALARPVLADAAFGGVSGATATPDNPLLGAAAGATLGAGGGMFGRAAGRTIGRGFRGIQNADVQGLRAAGIPLTIGQAAGGAIKSIEDRFSGLPIVDRVLAKRQTEGLQALNKTAFDEGLSDIGMTTNGVIGAQGVEAAQAARSQGYANALDNVQVQADAPFVADMQGAINAGRALPDPMSGNLDYTLPTRVGNSFDANGGLSGRDFQQAIRGLRRDAKSVEQLPYGYDFGQVTRQAEGALEGLLNRQAPGAVPAYQAANRANMKVGVLRDAVNAARNGTRSGQTDLFTASQLSDAAAAAAKKFGGTQGTTQQPFFNLTRMAQNVLPSKVPDSGTAGRLAVQAGLGTAGLGAVGGGGYAANGSEGAATGIGGTLALGGLLALGGSRGGQALAVRALADRPDALIRIGNGLYNRAALGGMFGAGLGSSIPLLAQP